MWRQKLQQVQLRWPQHVSSTTRRNPYNQSTRMIKKASQRLFIRLDFDANSKLLRVFRLLTHFCNLGPTKKQHNCFWKVNHPFFLSLLDETSVFQPFRLFKPGRPAPIIGTPRDDVDMDLLRQAAEGLVGEPTSIDLALARRG